MRLSVSLLLLLSILPWTGCATSYSYKIVQLGDQYVPLDKTGDPIPTLTGQDFLAFAQLRYENISPDGSYQTGFLPSVIINMNDTAANEGGAPRTSASAAANVTSPSATNTVDSGVEGAVEDTGPPE
jgi:hypothetical protein